MCILLGRIRGFIILIVADIIIGIGRTVRLYRKGVLGGFRGLGRVGLVGLLMCFMLIRRGSWRICLLDRGRIMIGVGIGPRKHSNSVIIK